MTRRARREVKEVESRNERRRGRRGGVRGGTGEPRGGGLDFFVFFGFGRRVFCVNECEGGRRFVTRGLSRRGMKLIKSASSFRRVSGVGCGGVYVRKGAPMGSDSSIARNVL